MTFLHRLASVLRWVFNRDRAERGLDDELQTFVDMAAAARMRDGLPAAEARRLAILELGGVEQTKERVRTYRHGAWLDEAGRDIRYAFRMCLKAPGFTGIIVLTLALGIGANTAIFSLIDALMLRWLPVPNPQELVQLTLQAPGHDRARAERPSPTRSSRALAEQEEIFSGVAGFNAFTFDVGAPGSVSRVHGALVTGAYFDTLGLTPALGRLLTREDDDPRRAAGGGRQLRLLGAAIRAQPRAIGRSLQINGVPVTVVGVSPRGFVGANVGSIADITMAAADASAGEPERGAAAGSRQLLAARPRAAQTGPVDSRRRRRVSTPCGRGSRSR